MKKKVLFIDRDGTIIKEPPITFQVDTLDQLSFLPGAIRNLYRISHELGYELVMVSNQDGLGTASYSEENFNIVQNKMLEILASEGIFFEDILIDRSFEYEKLDTRKPGIGMLRKYFSDLYDLKNSYVIGDRLTDIQLAKNLGTGAIFISSDTNATMPINDADLTTTDWDDIHDFLKYKCRKAILQRRTAETDIKVELNLNGKGYYKIDTGIGFFDHMLEQVARHGNVDIQLRAIGDIHIDEHHTIEDTGIALGAAFLEALGNKKGIERYGYCLPMDDCLAQVAIDFGGRSWLVWDAQFTREYVGQVSTEMFSHFFKSFCDGARCNLNIKAEGTNEHHKIEAIFKAFARSIKMAVTIDPSNMKLPSTKETL